MLKLNYTSEMEKAMQGAHKVNFATYARKFAVRMRVERQREKDYLQSQRLLAKIR